MAMEATSTTGPRHRAVSHWLAAAGGAALVVAAAAVWLWSRGQPVMSESTDDSELEEFTAPIANPGYVGIETCAECHAERVKEVKATRHVVACTPASGVEHRDICPAEASTPRAIQPFILKCGGTARST
ncbi:MAG: hypothetical protein NZO58_05415 [Gemmataceae bacterium]|nr:hypothetical protein [Gemmataceae bacterium]